MELANVNVPLTPQKRKLVIFAVMAQQFGFMLTSFGPGLALPTIMNQFSTMQYYAFVGALYAFFQCIVAPVVSCLGDRIGRKWINTISLICMCAALAFTYFAPSFISFAIAWSLCGVCVGGFLTGPFLIMSDVTEPKERAKYAGFLASAISAGMIVAPIVSGLVVDAGWIRGVYLLPLPFYLISIIIIGSIFPNKRGSGKLKFDGLGTLFLITTVAPLVLLLNFGGKLFPWLSIQSAICLVVLVVSAIALIKRELKVEQPAIHLKLLKNRFVALTSAFSFLFGAYAVLTAGFLVLFAQAILNTSATVSGTLMLPQTIVSLLLPLLIGPWVSKDRRRFKLCIMIEGVLGAATLIGISQLTGNSSIAILYALMVLGGIANACFNTCNIPFMQQGVDRSMYGAAQGNSQFFSVLGVTLVSSLFGLVLTSVPDYTRALSIVFIIGGILCLLVGVIAFIFIKKPEAPSAEAAQ